MVNPKTVPRKNIYPILSDIKLPEKIDVSPPKSIFSETAGAASRTEHRRGRNANATELRRNLAILASFLFISAGSFYAFKFWGFADNARKAMGNVYSSFGEAVNNLGDKDFSGAAARLGTINNDLGNIAQNAQNLGLFNVSSLLGNFWETAKTLPAAFLDLRKLGQTALAALEELEFLENNALRLVIGGNGQELISRFMNLRDKIASADSESKSLQSNLSRMDGAGLGLGDINYAFSRAYFQAAPDFYKVGAILNSSIDFLNQPEDLHLLILFQNPSEMRPGGGFIGSYADAVLRGGSLTRFDVKDIYDPDGQLDLKIAPPRPLAGIVGQWGARDANWFFDFPTSAKKIKYFMENSKIYKEQGIKFQMVVAVNDGILKDILKITGPIDLPDYRMKIDDTNFMTLIQEEVESGKDKKAGAPKRILKVLAPVLLQKIRDISNDQKKEMFNDLKLYFQKKDIMLYSSNDNMEKTLVDNNLAGNAFMSEQGSSGDYLAVVDTNVAGGKSDIFVDQKIDLVSQLTAEGDVLDNLIIKRVHNGNSRPEPWYRAVNKNYMKIFTPTGSKFGFMDGGVKKSMPRYSNADYPIDEDLAKIYENETYIKESGVWMGNEEGKNTFATWFDLPAGTSKELKLDYKIPHAFDLAKGGYQFVYEKQSGARGPVRIGLVAPDGYKWQESGSQFYQYETEDPDGRIILNLNLIKSD